MIQDDPGGLQATSVTVVMTLTERAGGTSKVVSSFRSSHVQLKAHLRFFLKEKHVAALKVGQDLCLSSAGVVWFTGAQHQYFWPFQHFLRPRKRTTYEGLSKSVSLMMILESLKANEMLPYDEGNCRFIELILKDTQNVGFSGCWVFPFRVKLQFYLVGTTSL